VNIVVRGTEGGEQDITEGVQALYDLLIDSMDWGSDMLSAEDARPIALLARACCFERAAEAERYLREREHVEQQTKFIQKRQQEADHRSRDGWVFNVHWYGAAGVPLEHDHVFSTVGRCMWLGCNELGEMDPL
jgi:hypothetical protein